MKIVLWSAAVACVIGAVVAFFALMPISDGDMIVLRAQALISGSRAPMNTPWSDALYPSIGLLALGLVLAAGGSILHKMDKKS